MRIALYRKSGTGAQKITNSQPKIVENMLEAAVVQLRAHYWEREHGLADPPEKVVVEIFTAMLLAGNEAVDRAIFDTRRSA